LDEPPPENFKTKKKLIIKTVLPYSLHQGKNKAHIRRERELLLLLLDFAGDIKEGVSY
jgi:hypothetical protein